MERILVGMDLGDNSSWAGIHALNLAKRINATVTFLLVVEPDLNKGRDNPLREKEVAMRKRLAELVQQGRASGIGVDSFVIYGTYDKELVRFIKENKITMLVVGPSSNSKASSNQIAQLLEKVRHSIDCRIEVVNQKNSESTMKRRR
jgi:nucleotide-binding universal stress UspA family protein